MPTMFGNKFGLFRSRKAAAPAVDRTVVDGPYYLGVLVKERARR